MCQRSRQNEHLIDRLRRIPLEPAEYCRRWVKGPAKGHRKTCINALAEATGLSPGTIRNWGFNFERRPQYVLYVLRQADLLNQLKALDEANQISIPKDALQE